MPRRRIRPPASGSAPHQFVRAEYLFCEECRGSQFHGTVEFVGGVAGLLQAREIDPDGLQQRSRNRAVLVDNFEVGSAAVEQQHAVVVMELVALGVAAEIVVVVEEQHFRAAPRVIRRKNTPRKARSFRRLRSPGHNARLCPWGCPNAPVGECVRHFERPGMTAPHTRARRRIIFARLLAPVPVALARIMEAKAPTLLVGSSELVKATPTPLRKSRRVILRSIPSSRSCPYDISVPS